MLFLLAFLSSATYTVESFGAIPNDGNSDCAAFESAYAAACDDSEPALITAGAGTFDMPKVDNRSCVFVSGCTDVTFSGVASTLDCGIAGCAGSPSTTILRGQTGTIIGDYMIFAVADGSGIAFQDFVCDGRKGSIVSADEQTHCIEFARTSSTSVVRSYFHDMYGDSVKYVAAGEGTPAGVTVTDTWHKDNGRSGLAFNGAGNVVIDGYVASGISDQAIDLEPGGGFGIQGITIRDAWLGAPSSAGVYTLTLSGGTSPTRDALVQNSRIDGGINAIMLEGATFDNVRIDAADRPAVDLPRYVRDILIRHSTISVASGFDAIAFAAISEAESPSEIYIDTVRVTIKDSSRAFTIEGGPGEVSVSGFVVRTGQLPNQNFNGEGVRVSSTNVGSAVLLDNLNFAGLDIQGVQYGGTWGQLLNAPGITGSMAGTVSIVDQSASIGVFCAASSLTLVRTGLTIAADTATSGCP